MPTKIYHNHFLIYAAIAIVTILAYWHIYQIPFLYSENILINKSTIQDLSLFFEHLSIRQWKALVGKPFVNLTFAINYAFSAKNPAAYHLTNLIIHLVNVMLVYLLAQRFFKLPWLCASLFALHPIATACVSQIFGRTYSLGSCFMLLALYVYFSAWQRQYFTRNTIVILTVLFMLMLLTKQSFVFFPFILLWHMLCFPNFLRNTPTLNVKTLTGLWLSMTIIGIGIVLFFAVFYAAPLSATAAVTPEVYIFSQLGNIPNLLAFYFLPFQTALRHELPFYSHLTSPHVLLGIGYLLAFVTIMIRFRRTTIGFLMGAMLIALLPTNTIFPKDEIILEWRLYPSLVFFCFFIGNLVYLGYNAFFSRMTTFSRISIGAGMLFYMLYLSSFGWTIWQQNNMYRSNISAWEQVLDRYPYSANAANNLGTIYFTQQDYNNALVYYKKAAQINPTSSTYMFNLAKTYQALGQTTLGDDARQQARALRKLYGSQMTSVYMGD